MNEQELYGDHLLESLNERAKELKCLYQIEEVLKNESFEPETIFQRIIDIIPSGWMYSQLCRVRIEYEKRSYQSPAFQRTAWLQQAEIKINDRTAGRIEVCYPPGIRVGGKNPFLPEEQTLLNTIAVRVGVFFAQQQLKKTVLEWENAKNALEQREKKKWQVILEVLEKVNMSLFLRISRKMLNHLCWIGAEEARSILQCVGLRKDCKIVESVFETNKPSEKKAFVSVNALSNMIFRIADKFLSDAEILALVQKWTGEDKVGFLVKALEFHDSSLSDIAAALSRYYHMASDEREVSEFTKSNIHSLLIQSIFTEQLEFVNIAKDYVEIDDFHTILEHTIYAHKSHGRLGGKSAGLFVACNIIRKHQQDDQLLQDIRVPKTWYIASDMLHHFIYHNNLEEIFEQKYKQIDQVREEYPNIVQVFKNSNFPPEIVNGLSLALDDLGEQPIIVRSSSLLEDRLGTAFSGKYKSLFLANQGPKHARLAALLDAVGEVYASTFGPDPLEYRKEKGLLDFREEMAVMIQEVVGTRVGIYYLPCFAGVAFSNNEFKWSPRIKREDGLIRMVPGLGTRAVDRLSDDYPKLIAPGKPALNVNVSPEEIFRYSPKEIDVINLESNSFETIPMPDLLRAFGEEYPNVANVVSVFSNARIASKSLFNLDFEKDSLIVTFEGLVSKTPWVKKMKKVLDLLKEKMHLPVDIEFASTGKDLYLLQCRPQAYHSTNKPALIPQDLPEEKIIFTANRYVSNGHIPEISHIVYVPPEKYNELATMEELRSVGRAVGKLNSILPKRRFILIGPGRWGSRGDVRLGVNVTYSDINNTSLLVEVARKKGSYVPDLSFGTHFFQDLVEASIRYLPLYPDESGILFNERFLLESENMFASIVPEYGALQDVIHVVDVSRETGGDILKVRMNADLDRAIAYLSSQEDLPAAEESPRQSMDRETRNYWKWRLQMAEHIASRLDPKRFGIKALYVFGSTKNANAGLGSDIDLLIHFAGDEKMRKELLDWFEGWSLCLAQMNYLKTGYRSEGLLDVHIITDKDIKEKTSFAVKIGAATDPARPLRMGDNV